MWGLGVVTLSWDCLCQDSATSSEAGATATWPAFHEPEGRSVCEVPYPAAGLLRLGLALMFIALIASFALADLVHAGAQSLGMGASQQARAAEAIPEIVITVLLPLGVGIFCSSFVVAALCRSHRSEQAVIGSSDSKHPKTTSLPGAMSASAIAGLGLTLITLTLIARFTLDNLMDTYANYVGVSTELGTDLQFSAASYLTGALNMLLLPLGIGFFCSSLVVAALPHSRRHDRAAVNQPRPDTDINQE